MTSLSSFQRAEKCEHERSQLTHKILVEVKKRPLLWRKADLLYTNRWAHHNAWVEIGRVIGVKPFTAKLKWRHLRDIFQKELKRIQRQLVQGGNIKDLKLWTYFKNMMFLKEEYMDPDQYPVIEVEEVEPDLKQPESPDEIVIVKREIDENSNSSIEQLQEKYLQELNVLAKSIETNQVSRQTSDSTDTRNTENVTVNVIEISEAPEVVDNSDISVAESSNAAKKRKIDNGYKDRIDRRTVDRAEAEDNEDMLFVKSLVPYFEHLNPVRKLRLKSRIQNLIADELEKDQEV